MCNDNIALPVELLSFLAKNSDGEVTLTWKTATELNNDFFTLERSGDGKSFEKIATIKGSGTTKHVTSYEYVDARPLAGLSFYRLSQTDFDGTSEVFKPVSVDVAKAGNGSKEEATVHAFPNPLVGNTLNITFDDPQQGAIEIIDSKGNKILSQAVDGSSSDLQLELSDNTQPGLYYVNYKSGSKVETLKIIKQR